MKEIPHNKGCPWMAGQLGLFFNFTSSVFPKVSIVHMSLIFGICVY